MHSTLGHALTSELQVVQGRVCLQRKEIQRAVQPGSDNPEGETQAREERPFPAPRELPRQSTNQAGSPCEGALLSARERGELFWIFSYQEG